jgi:hypothetical protein
MDVKATGSDMKPFLFDTELRVSRYLYISLYAVQLPNVFQGVST